MSGYQMCPTCNAQPGYPCANSMGITMSTVHDDRRSADDEDEFAVAAFYAKARWPLGQLVTHVDDPTLRGQIVKRGGQQWASRDRLPWVRWHGKIDAVEVPLDELREVR